jgi:hypothetical protein
LRVKPNRYERGQWVYYYNSRHFRGREDKWSRKFSGPYLVIEVLPPVNLKIQRSPRSKPFYVHFDKVKPWLGDAPKSWLHNSDAPNRSTGSFQSDATLSSDAEFDNSEQVDQTVDWQELQGDHNQPLSIDPIVDAYAEDELPLARPHRAKKRPAYLGDFV